MQVIQRWNNLSPIKPSAVFREDTLSWQMEKQLQEQ